MKYIDDFSADLERSIISIYLGSVFISGTKY